MKNFVQPGEAMTIPAPATVVAGAGVLAGSIFGVAQNSAATGADLTIERTGVFELTKLGAQAWTLGAKVYWDAANARCTTVATSNTLIGAAAAVAADPSSTGLVLLTGQIA